MPQVRRVFPSELFGPGGSVLVILLITQQVLGVFKLADTARKERDMGKHVLPSPAEGRDHVGV